ncbi:MAG: hypothetical protein JW896_14010 [Deltaproteobacteria bacterium]|nr:hypothetical protein [Deltaproteobacteria bacterium]
MFKKISFIFLSFMFFALFSVSTTLAKNDKPKNDKNTPNRSERALEQQERNTQQREVGDKEKGPKGGPSGQNGRSFMGKLYFFEEDADPEEMIVEEEEGDTPEEPVDSEPGEDFIDEENDDLEIAWGKMNYNLVGPYFKFVFNGHGLEVDTDYTLIYYPNYPEGDGTDLICLGSGMADEYGNVHINERLYGLCDLPIPEDANDGAQLILALTDDIDCEGAGVQETWDTAFYLFGFNLMRFDDTTCEITSPPPEEEPEPEPEEDL